MGTETEKAGGRATLAEAWARVNEGLTETQREKVRLYLAAVQFSRAALDEARLGHGQTARSFALGYFSAFEELRRVAGAADEDATVRHVETIARLVASRGWQVFGQACSIHALMRKLAGKEAAQ